MAIIDQSTLDEINASSNLINKRVSDLEAYVFGALSPHITKNAIQYGAGRVVMNANGLFGRDNSSTLGVSSFLLASMAFNANRWSNNQSESLAAGSVMLGSNAANYANLLWDPSAKQLKFRGGTTVQAYIDTNGAITAGGGNVVIDSSGITFVAPTSTTGYIFWKQSIGGTLVADIGSKFVAGSNYLEIVTNNNATTSQIFSAAKAPAGGSSISMSTSATLDEVRFYGGASLNAGLDFFGVGSASTNASIVFAPKSLSATNRRGFEFDAAADTSVSQATENNDVYFKLSRTEQWTGGGTFTTQRAFFIDAPTYAATIATTITNAATFAISGAPIAGANMTLTNPYALWVQGGKAQFDGAATFGVNPIISNAAPQLTFNDTTASAFGMDIVVDANKADFKDKGGTAGSLLSLDLANNFMGLGTTTYDFAGSGGTEFSMYHATLISNIDLATGSNVNTQAVGRLSFIANASSVKRIAFIDVLLDNSDASYGGKMRLATKAAGSAAAIALTLNGDGTLNIAKTVSTYNAVATQGYGLPAIVGRVSQTAQTASIASTNFANAGTAGEYIVFGYLYVTTADAAATGNVNFTISWNDGTAARTSTAGAVPFANTSGISESVSKGVVVYIRLGSGSIAWSTTVTATVGSAQYAIYLTCLRVN